MTSCLETCKTGKIAGSIVGGLAGVAADTALSIIYVRPFIHHLMDSKAETEEIITALIALFGLLVLVPPGVLIGKVAGPPIAVAMRGIYGCGSAGVSALRSLSLFRHTAGGESLPVDLEQGEEERALLPPNKPNGARTGAQ